MLNSVVCVHRDGRGVTAMTPARWDSSGPAARWNASVLPTVCVIPFWDVFANLGGRGAIVKAFARKVITEMAVGTRVNVNITRPAITSMVVYAQVVGGGHGVITLAQSGDLVRTAPRCAGVETAGRVITSMAASAHRAGEERTATTHVRLGRTVTAARWSAKDVITAAHVIT